jgi:hypothetical protein
VLSLLPLPVVFGCAGPLSGAPSTASARKPHVRTLREGSLAVAHESALAIRTAAFRACVQAQLQDAVPLANSSALGQAAPNPSIERTSSSQLRCLAAAAHVER